MPPAKRITAETPAQKTVASSNQTVTIACKIGVAWLDLELFEEHEVKENTQTGPRTIKQWFRTGQMVRVRGTAYPRGEPPEGFPEKPTLTVGYALTRGVPKAFWDQWVHQNRLAPMVKSEMIFACESMDELKGIATEHKEHLSGLEPVQRNKDGITDTRLPRSTNKAITELEPANRPN